MVAPFFSTTKASVIKTDAAMTMIEGTEHNFLFGVKYKLKN
jgi:hypothetical protein